MDEMLLRRLMRKMADPDLAADQHMTIAAIWELGARHGRDVWALERLEYGERLDQVSVVASIAAHELFGRGVTR